MKTLDEQIAAVRREIAMRKRVYPRWVSAGRLTQAQSDHEIACMEAALSSLQAMQAPEPEQGTLI